MMAKVRFAEKPRQGARGKTTSKAKPKSKVKMKAKPAPKTAKPASKTAKPAAKKKPAAKTKVAVAPKLVAMPSVLARPRVAAPAKIKAPKPVPVHDVSLLKIVMDQLVDAKAEDIVSINLDGKSAIADNMVVASGRSNRHVGAIADQLIDKLKAAGQRHLRVEGMDTCDWVLVDAVDVIVHLFRPEVRSFYNLEKLWSEHSPQEPHAE